MSEMHECRERLEGAHKQMQDAMTELITKTIRKLSGYCTLPTSMLDLIEDMGGNVVRSGLWT